MISISGDELAKWPKKDRDFWVKTGRIRTTNEGSK